LWRSRRRRCWGSDVDIDAKLVFTAPADGSGRLVFGDSGAAVVPDAVFSIDGDLPGLGTLTMHAGSLLSIDVELPGLDGTIGLAWDANVSRGMRAEVQACWQEAQLVAAGVATAWQGGEPVRAAVAATWQQGQRMAAAVDTRWQETERTRAAVAAAWQEGIRLRNAVVSDWQESHRMRAAVAAAWQQGTPRRGAVLSRWEETERLRAGLVAHWQHGAPVRHAVLGRWGDGLHVHQVLRTHWQEGRRPPAGVSVVPPIDPPGEPCYDPATVGRLVFTDLALGDGKLVFVCQRPGQVLPPATVVILPRRSYILINSVEIRRADALGGDPLPAENFQMQLDRRSWSWSWSASFHASAREAVTPSLVTGPVELEVRVNGQPFRLMSETVGRSRRLPEHLVAARGRGKAAVLDAPHAEVQTFGSALDRTAHQLMTEVLTVNGVGFGWSVDFQLTDWLVPGGVWMHQGTWISALADIASSVGGYLQPHDTEPILRVLPSWPAPWWEWAGMTPDVELPAGVGEFEEVEIIDLPGYNRIFVSGQAGGIAADLTRNGTAGDVLKQPMAVHPLITTIGAAKQRARAELSGSGRGLHHKLLMPVHPAAGVIKPGTILRFTDDENAIRLGLVRSTSVSEAFPVLTQNLEIESHA
jgi:hypothetical protein